MAKKKQPPKKRRRVQIRRQIKTSTYHLDDPAPRPIVITVANYEAVFSGPELCVLDPKGIDALIRALRTANREIKARYCSQIKFWIQRHEEKVAAEKESRVDS